MAQPQQYTIQKNISNIGSSHNPIEIQECSPSFHIDKTSVEDPKHRFQITQQQFLECQAGLNLNIPKNNLTLINPTFDEGQGFNHEFISETIHKINEKQLIFQEIPQEGLYKYTPPMDIPNDQIEKQSIFAIVLLTSLIYFAQSSSRTVWAVCKPQIQEALVISIEQLSVLDLTYLLFHCTGLFISISLLSHKANLKYFLGLGVMMSSSFLFFISILDLIESKNYILYLSLMGLNGLFDSVMFPSCITILNNWINEREKGFYLSLWSTFNNLGSILGLFIGSFLTIRMDIEWSHSLLIISLFQMICAGQILLFLEPSPNKFEKADLHLKLLKKEHQIKNPNVIKNLLYFRGFIVLILAICLIVSVNKGVHYWLPYYLSHLGMKQHGALIAIMFDFGTIIGGLFIGYISDLLQKRFIIMEIFVSVSVVGFLMAAFQVSAKYQLYMCICFTLGVFFGGTAKICPSAIIELMALNSTSRMSQTEIIKSIAFIEGITCLVAAFCQVIFAKTISSLFLAFTIISVMVFGLLLPVLKSANQLKLGKNITKYNFITNSQL